MTDKTPLAERTRIVLAGLRNSGKSSFLNHLFEKDVAIVSDTPGTTTDPVTRPYELIGYGPIAVTDTAGLGDEGEIGRLRTDSTKKRLSEADLMILVTRIDIPLSGIERELLASSGRPKLTVLTFADRTPDPSKLAELKDIPSAPVDNIGRTGMPGVLKILKEQLNTLSPEPGPVEGLVNESDLVVLVTPIDLAAPKGRLILPQVETIRDLLDRDCASLVVKERELRSFYSNLGMKPKLVITDSQAFSRVAADIPEDQMLTSFSILFARKKGDLEQFVRGIKALTRLKNDARVTILEACSHHRQADDIGTVKIPRLIRELVSPGAVFNFSRELPAEDDPEKPDLVIMCGGCMVTRKTVLQRTAQLSGREIPVTNYGLFLAWANGLLPRALEPFPYEYGLYKEMTGKL